MTGICLLLTHEEGSQRNLEVLEHVRATRSHIVEELHIFLLFVLLRSHYKVIVEVL